ncbi:MAG: class IV adenylate cyclase [Candidatus Woesebacteria bacterium]|jgi:adenylate cyclase class 2
MQTEVEVKFLNVDHDKIRENLQANGAQLVLPMRTMRRVIMDYPDWRLQSQSSYVRVRDEGDKITLTYKRFDELSIDGAKEVQTHVQDYQTTVELLSHLGLVVTSTQQTRRETWQMGECEVVLDEWPWLKPYIEIEGPDVKSLQSVAKK